MFFHIKKNGIKDFFFQKHKIRMTTNSSTNSALHFLTQTKKTNINQCWRQVTMFTVAIVYIHFQQSKVKKRFHSLVFRMIQRRELYSKSLRNMNSHRMTCVVSHFFMCDILLQIIFFPFPSNIQTAHKQTQETTMCECNNRCGL